MYVPAVTYVAPVAYQPPIPYRAAISPCTEYPDGLPEQPAVEAVDAVLESAAQAETPARAEVAAHWELRIENKKLSVAASDFYVAYRPFCRDCRFVGHTTSSCPKRPARQASTGGLPPGVPIMPPGGFAPGMPVLPPGAIPPFMPPGFPAIPGFYPPFPGTPAPPGTPGKRARQDGL